MIALGWGVNANTAPVFTFKNNLIEGNTDVNPIVFLLGNSTAGYYNPIVFQGNTFTGNESQRELVNIYDERAGNQIVNNDFYNNKVATTTLSLIDSGSNWISDNAFLQNGAYAEVYLHASTKGPITLTRNTVAPSEGGSVGVWSQVSGQATLQSFGNSFYSNYNTKDGWNTPRTDVVALWGNYLTIDKWNAKTSKDGNDILAPIGTPPPAH